MKIILSWTRHHYVARVSIFLVVVTLIAGMVGCVQVTPPPSYNLTVASTAGGSVTTPGEGSFVCLVGEVVNLVATPAAGYRFVNWTGNVGAIASVNAASTTIIMNGDYSITANFVRRYNLTISSSSTALGTVTTPGTGTYTYDAGTVVNLVATPAVLCRFVNWTGNVGTIGSVNAATTTITVNGDYSITANFVPIPPPPPPPPVRYNLTTTSTAGGSVTTPGEGTFTYNAGTVVNLVATPASGYQFVNWTGNIGTIANVNAASTTITMNGDYSITANFVKRYNLTISSTAGGTVTTPGVGTFTRDAGTVVNLVATPANVVYQFVNWTGDVATVANVNSASTTITMSGNYIVTANFVRQPITSIIFNGDVSEKIDVVFVGSGFPDITSFRQSILELIDYDGITNGLMYSEPFRANRTRFNFWMVETLQTFTNTNFRDESTNLVDSIAPFRDRKVVLFVTPRIWSNADVWGYRSNTTGQWIWTDSGGLGAYVTVGNQFLTGADTEWPALYGNTEWPLLYADYDAVGTRYTTPQPLARRRYQVRIAFVHEFGHSFGGLWDEYDLGRGTAAQNNVGPPTYTPNADYPPCTKWSTITSDCYAPCGYTDWRRSSFNSIMRDPYSSRAPQFNTVSINELLRDMNSSPVYSTTSYTLSITYSNGTFIPGNLTVVAAPPPGGSSSQPSTGYTVQISSASGTILYSTKVGVTAVVGAPSPDWFDEDGSQIYFPHEMLHIFDPFETKLILPSFSDAKKISMYDPEGMLVFDVHI